MPDAFEQGKSESERGEHLQIHSYTSGNVSFSHDEVLEVLHNALELLASGQKTDEIFFDQTDGELPHVMPSSDLSFLSLRGAKEEFERYMEYIPENVVYKDLFGRRYTSESVCDEDGTPYYFFKETAEKKKAAFVVLVRMLSAAGICKKEWREQMYEMMM